MGAHHTVPAEAPSVHRSRPGARAAGSAAGHVSYPSATAMAWQGHGLDHAAVAVPGVRLEPGDALVAVELATVCARDLSVVLGRVPASVPLVLGHEQVGVVVDVAPGAKTTRGRSLGVGDRVVWAPVIGCARCVRCRRGHPELCVSARRYGRERTRRGWELSGGFATHVHLKAGSAIVRVPASVPASALAPASCAGVTAVAALDAATTAAAVAGEVVIVSGAGMPGLNAIALAKRAGACVVAVDPVAVRRERALAFGADAAVDVAGGPARLRSVLHRLGRRGDVARIAIETSGEAAAVKALVDVVGVGGVVVVAEPDGVTAAHGEPTLDLRRLASRMLTVRGVCGSTADRLERAVEFAVQGSGTVPLAEQVGRVFGLSQASEALEWALTDESPRIGIAPYA